MCETSRELSQDRLGSERPRTCRPILARGERPAAVRAERDTGHATAMPEELRLRCARESVPDPRCPVAAGREYLAAVRAERDRIDEARVAHELQ